MVTVQAEEPLADLLVGDSAAVEARRDARRPVNACDRFPPKSCGAEAAPRPVTLKQNNAAVHSHNSCCFGYGPVSLRLTAPRGAVLAYRLQEPGSALAVSRPVAGSRQRGRDSSPGGRIHARLAVLVRRHRLGRPGRGVRAVSFSGGGSPEFHRFCAWRGNLRPFGQGVVLSATSSC
jgi:hypothetical protein